MQLSIEEEETPLVFTRLLLLFGIQLSIEEEKGMPDNSARKRGQVGP
jgi:hypothetical protein